MTLLIVFATLSILFSFLCSILEAVLLSVTPTFINLKKKEGKAFATKLEEIKKDVDKPLIAILTLNTVAHTVGAILVGTQAEEAFGGDTPEQTLMRHLSACFAEYEKAIISKRTKDGLAAKRRRGEKTGGHVPYAYQIKTDGGRVKVLEPKADEIEVLNEMKKWKKEGLTYHRIVDKLNNLEIPSATGGIWHYTSVYNVMNRREYQYTSEG